MKREEEIKQAAYHYGVLHAKNEIYQEDPAFIAGAEWADEHPTVFNQCVNEQSPDYLAGYEQGRKDSGLPNKKVYKIQYEDTGYDCWGKFESYGWKDIDNKAVYTTKELAQTAMKEIRGYGHSPLRIKEIDLV